MHAAPWPAQVQQSLTFRSGADETGGSAVCCRPPAIPAFHLTPLCHARVPFMLKMTRCSHIHDLAKCATGVLLLCTGVQRGGKVTATLQVHAKLAAKAAYMQLWHIVIRVFRYSHAFGIVKWPNSASFFTMRPR